MNLMCKKFTITNYSITQERGNKMTNVERLNLLNKKYWTYIDISNYCGTSSSVAQKIKKKIKDSYPNAVNKYNSRWIDSEFVIKEFFQESKEIHIKKLISNQEILNLLGGINNANQAS